MRVPMQVQVQGRTWCAIAHPGFSGHLGPPCTTGFICINYLADSECAKIGFVMFQRSGKLEMSVLQIFAAFFMPLLLILRQDYYHRRKPYYQIKCYRIVCDTFLSRVQNTNYQQFKQRKISRNFKNFVSEKSYVSCPTSHESTINTYNVHRRTFTNKHKTHIHSHKHTQIHELSKFPICKRERRSTKAIVKRSFSFIHKWAYVLDNVCAEASIIQGTKWTLRFCCEFECR